MIFGLSGTNGAGKDTVGEILRDNHTYLFISVTDLLREEARRRGLEITRQNLRSISAEWRREHGMGVLVDKAIAEYKKVKDRYVSLVVSSLRHPAEADAIHQAGGKVVWVDADPRVRYERVQKHAERRNRQAEDGISFKEFLEHERIEMDEPGDAATLSISAVKSKADISLINEADSIDEFAAMVKKTLNP